MAPSNSDTDDVGRGPSREPVDAVAPVRPLDQALLGLEPHPDQSSCLSFVVQPHLCRTDGRFYGGAALAAALAAGEAATGRAALWSSTQLVASADLGERVRLDVDVLAAGRSASQVHVRGMVGDRLIFNAVGSTADHRAGGLHGVGQVMPTVPPPEACEPWRGAGPPGAEPIPAVHPGREHTAGHRLVSEYRDAPIHGHAADRPGHMALWSRLTGPVAPSSPSMTPAALGFLADLVPIACCRACGVFGAGTSLDQSLRVGEDVDTEWVLVELDAHVVVGDFGHGDVLLWSPDGRLLATGSQSARLFTMEEFARGFR